MAVLTEAAKKKVPKSKRGVPGKSGTGSYPMPDKEHAHIAESYAAKYHGKNSAFAKKIRAKAHKLYPSMGKSGKTLSDLA
jgi:hypothetical protein